MVQLNLKKLITLFLFILSSSIAFAQLPRMRFTQIQQDTTFGSVLISGQDSNITYSRDFYITNNMLKFYGDTIETKRYVDSLSDTKVNRDLLNATGTLPVANGGTGATSFTAGRVLFGNGTSAVNTDASLFWDNTDKRLGIGLTAPRTKLEVLDDQIISSSNVWTSRTSAADNDWYSVTYGNGLFVAVSLTGTGNRVMTSPDGINWTSRTSAADNQWFSVTYGNGLFVAVSITGTGNRVMTSPDGINWTLRTSAADNEWRSVTYGNGLFVAVSRTGTGNRVMTSPDGINWTSRTSAADNNWNSVTYGNGLFVAVSSTGTGNRVMTSPDGINWTSRTSAADNTWLSVTYGNGLFVAVSLTGTGNRVMTSPDGINWTSRTSAADNQWLSVTYGNGLFVAVSFTGTGNRVITSPDGINWTSRTSAADNNWNSVTYGNGLFVAVSITGTGNRVMSSGKQYKNDLAHNNQINGNQYYTGNIGAGLSSPTAALHLKAGTASANTAPLKFTSGTNLTTPEAGAVEYDGTDFFITKSDAVRRTIVTGTGTTNAIAKFGSSSTVQTATNLREVSDTVFVDKFLNVDNGTLYVNSTDSIVNIGAKELNLFLPTGSKNQIIRLRSNITNGDAFLYNSANFQGDRAAMTVNAYSDGLTWIKTKNNASVWAFQLRTFEDDFVVLRSDTGSIVSFVTMFQVKSNGDVVIADLAGSGTRAVEATANGTLQAPSTMMIKENIEQSNYGLSTLLNLKPVTFYYKDKQVYGSVRDIGFLAEEVYEILPEASGQNADGSYYLDKSKLSAVLVKAIQEQQTIIETQNNKITQLEMENQTLMNEIANIKSQIQLLIQEINLQKNE